MLLLESTALGGIGDVSGLRLGMTIDEAKSQLGAEYHSRVLKSPNDPAYQEMTLTREKDGNKDGYILDALDGKVFMIARTSQTAHDKPLGEAAMKEQVEQKYGKPTYDNAQNLGILAWVYDAQGNIESPTGFDSNHKPSYFFEKCRIDNTRQSPSLEIGIGVLLPAQYRGDCGTVLEIKGVGGRTDHIVEAFNVRLVDNHSMYLHLQAKAAEAAKKAKQERDANQKRTTPM